jgi:MFS family permease
MEGQMTSTRAGRSTAARIVPALALVAVAGACALFVLSTRPVDDPSGTAAGQAASLALPAIFTAGLALLAAALLFVAGDLSPTYRAGGLLGMCSAIGAAAGGLINLIGYANTTIWWAADPAAIRTSAAVLLVVALIGLAVVASEQLRPNWRPRQDSNLRPRD